jgi:hypothetical protein
VLFILFCLLVSVPFIVRYRMKQRMDAYNRKIEQGYILRESRNINGERTHYWERPEDKDDARNSHHKPDDEK